MTHTVDEMTPLWIFPIYPLLLTGPMAAALMPSQARLRALEMAAAALALQGIGFMISLMIYSAYIYRLMTRKLPRASARPGMFVSVGPSAFTAVGLVQLGAEAGKILGEGQSKALAAAAPILGLGTLVAGVWLWGLALWFFLVSAAANIGTAGARRLHFGLAWWGYVFPNTAFVQATFAIGEALHSHALQVVGTALAGALVVAWACVAGMTLRAVVRREVLWKGKDEDSGGATATVGGRVWGGGAHDMRRA